MTGLTGDDLAERLDEHRRVRCAWAVSFSPSRTTTGHQKTTSTPSGHSPATVVDTASDGSGCEFHPLVTTDAELGSVVRVPVESPAAAPKWTARYVSGEPYNVLLDLQEQVAAYATEPGRELGIDVNFGAVADVDTAPDHFMARQGRTFGDDPGIVAALANAVVRGHCEVGVAADAQALPEPGRHARRPAR